MSEEAIWHPRNPVLGFLFAASFLAAAALGIVALAFELTSLGDLNSRRVVGFLFVGPFIFGAIGTATLVRAFRAVKPWRHYLAITPVEQRGFDRAHDLEGQPLWPLIVFGLLAFVGQLAILFVVQPGKMAGSVAGLCLFIEVNLLLLTLWAACFGLLAQCLAARRLRAGRSGA